jgi:hypothetical protein
MMSISELTADDLKRLNRQWSDQTMAVYSVVSVRPLFQFFTLAEPASRIYRFKAIIQMLVEYGINVISSIIRGLVRACRPNPLIPSLV